MNAKIKHLVPRYGALVLVSLLLLVQGAGAAPQAKTAQIEASAQPLISYQGTLTDENGDPINTAVTMKFALYDAISGGNLKWGTETQSVQVTDGLFNVLLGSVTAIDPAKLTGDLWLDIIVNNEPLTPRERMAGVLHALNGSSDPFIVNGVIRSSRAADPNTAGTLHLENSTTGNTWAIFTQAWNSDKLAFGVWDASSGTFSDLGGIQMDGTWSMTADLWVSGGLHSASAGIAGDVWSTGSVYAGTNLSAGASLYAAADVVAGGSMAVSGQGFFGGATYNEGAVNLQSQAVPLTFKEVDESGNTVSLWRMPLDGTNLRFDSSDNGIDFSAFHTPITMYPTGGVGCGAVLENNLQTPEEQAAGGSDRFEEGDVLCWGIDQLEKCATPNDPLVQAVADKGGRPIVMGAEVIKVIGPVKRGDYLVASQLPGYAMPTKSPTFGIVIAQALEDFEGEQGLIKAMIRKM